MSDVWHDLLIPPKRLQASSGFSCWPSATVLIEVWDPADHGAAELIRNALIEAGAHAEIAYGRRHNAFLRILPSSAYGADDYQLSVTQDSISISGDPAGRLYGCATLAEAIERQGLKPLPCVAIPPSAKIIIIIARPNTYQ